MDIKAWLKEQRISAEAYDVDVLLNDFLDEMEKGLRGDAGSLAMLPSYIGAAGKLLSKQPVAVIDAGGTNLRVGLACLDENGEVQLSGFSKQSMPGRDHEVHGEAFYALLVDALMPFHDKFESIGFCFSYPTAIQPDLDGRLLRWTKDIRIPDLVGKRIGAGLLQALAERGVYGKKVVLLNDTVAALLAGRAEYKANESSSYMGFILGTGTNTAYLEKNRNIVKLNAGEDSGSQVINVESGGFSAFERGTLERLLDNRREDAGKHIFEKSISGAYVGDLTLCLLQALADEQIVSPGGRIALAGMQELSTIHISNLVCGDVREAGALGTDVFTDADRDLAGTIFAAVIDRAAFFTAVNISAAVIKCGEGLDANHPVCVNIDGSTYYKTPGLAEKTQLQLSRILGSRGLHYRCIHVADAPAVGAAIAALSV